ncbi:three-helix bundle dimerization domain-containing protein [Microbacterium mangrovi]|uniref:three-helix bundle dimerization domain-containing protein n=1 Tax=Microbacterium mangrovi TaxID=1348253 RepID=UPI000B140597|nr:hypothetical protein [Microbacterium mangrovi]
MDAQNEQHALEEVGDRLSQLFPSVDRTTIDGIIQEEYARFDDAHVRDYVPTLTENAATERLRELAPLVLPVAPEGGEELQPVDSDVSLDPYEIEARSERTGQLNGEVSNN